MRIMSDIAPLQIHPTRHRGIGQYTAGALCALLRQPDVEQSHILFGNGHLPPPDLRFIDTRADWRLYYGDFPLFDYHPQHWVSQLGSYAAYWKAQLKRFAPDVLHIHSPFEWDSPLHTHYDSTPTVLTVYDLIPLRLEEHYLRRAPSWMKNGYRHVCRLVQQSDHIIVISEHSRTDVVELLNVEPQRISVATPGPSSLASCSISRQRIANLRREVGLHGGFVVSTSGFDYRKNMLGMLRSYARLDPRLRAEFPLVIVCKLETNEESYLYRQAAELGIETQVILTNYVADEVLATLYRMATVLFFPSLYEGFGMPVLDAMLCGLPVITSSVSALPEVAGDAAVLVDPLDLDEMADALTRVLESDSLRSEMRASGFAQAAKFSWDDTANVFSEVYALVGKHQKTAHISPVSLHQAPRVRSLALVSPLPPQHSGVADFSLDLLRALRQHLPVTAFVQNDLLSSVRQHVDGPVESVVRLPDLVRAAKIDTVLYQIGNSAFHHFQLPYLLAVPGVVQVHDGILHGLIYSLTFLKSDETGYRQELSYAHGQMGREHAEDVIHGRQPPALYEISVNRRIVNNAIGVIVHNRWTAAAVRTHGTNLPVEIIYHPVTREESAENLDRQTARTELGIPRDTLVLATFGRLNPAKRLDVILRAFARLHREIPHTQLFLVGELDLSTDAFKVPGLIKELGIVESVHITGYVERSRFVQYMAATDVALNLRYPHAGETSGTLVRLLNAGVPTITSNLGAFAEIPDDCCWMADVDDTEEELLLAYLRRLATDSTLRRQMGLNAVRFVRAQIPDWDRAAQLALDFIQRALVSQAPLLPRVQTLSEAARAATLPRFASVSSGAVPRSRKGLWRLLLRGVSFFVGWPGS